VLNDKDTYERTTRPVLVPHGKYHQQLNLQLLRCKYNDLNTTSPSQSTSYQKHAHASVAASGLVILDL